jgi:hypothetical protein
MLSLDMNSELILFLEENGFILDTIGGFRKITYNQIANDIKIVGYETSSRKNITQEFAIEIQQKFIDDYGRSKYGLLFYIIINRTDRLDLKIKKIINEIDNITSEVCSVNTFLEFSDVYDDHDMIFSSQDGVILDFSGDELVITNYCSNAIP